MQPPIACTLTPGADQDRAAELSGLAARALRSREQTADGERLVCPGGLGARHRRSGGRAADHRGAVRVSSALNRPLLRCFAAR
jgi:hypothetical protein